MTPSLAKNILVQGGLCKNLGAYYVMEIVFSWEAILQNVETDSEMADFTALVLSRCHLKPTDIPQLMLNRIYMHIRNMHTHFYGIFSGGITQQCASFHLNIIRGCDLLKNF